MLSVFLACDDPYKTARLMTDQLGWRLEFATPADSDDKVACVSLSDDTQVMLSTADAQYLPAASRQHRGAGVTVYIRLPQTNDIAAVHDRHAAGGVVTEPLSRRPWGEVAFDAVIAGYRFLISQEPVTGDL
ncbi:MAG TPA: VOC family protein [Streptosporangiaceae bacterium]|nr:VOC family protein [Streptosporangiaceae bacterium]